MLHVVNWDNSWVSSFWIELAIASVANRWIVVVGVHLIFAHARMAQKAPLLGKCRYVCNVERSMRSCCFTAGIISVCRCRQDVRM